MSQGKPTSVQKVARVKMLLLETDLTMNEIGDRLGLSAATIGIINKRTGIRNFNDERRQWTTEHGHCDVRIHVEGPTRRTARSTKDTRNDEL